MECVEFDFERLKIAIQNIDDSNPEIANFIAAGVQSLNKLLGSEDSTVPSDLESLQRNFTNYSKENSSLTIDVETGKALKSRLNKLIEEINLLTVTSRTSDSQPVLGESLSCSFSSRLIEQLRNTENLPSITERFDFSNKDLVCRTKQSSVFVVPDLITGEYALIKQPTKPEDLHRFLRENQIAPLS